MAYANFAIVPKRVRRAGLVAQALVLTAFSLTVTATPAQSAPIEPCADRLYTVNSYADNVSVVDTKTDQVITTFGVGHSPAWAVFTPDNRQLYVTNNGASSLSVIDVATSTVVQTIPTADKPIGIAFTPDNRRMVLSFSTGTVQIIDRISGRSSPYIAVGANPELIRLSPDGRYAYAVSALQGVYKVDIDSERVVAAIPVPHPDGRLLPYQYNLLVSPDGRRAYVSNTFGGFIEVIDTESNTAIGTFNAPGAVGLQLSADAKRLYVTNFWAASVDEYELESGRPLRTTGPTGIDLPSHLIIGPEGRYLYFGQSFGPKLLKFDTQTWKPVKTLEVGTGPNSVVVCHSASPR